MATAQPPLLRYEALIKFGWTAARCRRVAKVSACCSVCWWFESASCHSVQRCTWVWCGCFKSWRTNNEENKESGGGEKRREVIAQSNNQILFVSTWQPSVIVMTDQSRWISRADRSAIPVTALFSSSAIEGHLPKVLEGSLCCSSGHIRAAFVKCVGNNSPQSAYASAP